MQNLYCRLVDVFFFFFVLLLLVFEQLNSIPVPKILPSISKSGITERVVGLKKPAGCIRYGEVEYGVTIIYCTRASLSGD